MVTEERVEVKEAPVPEPANVLMTLKSHRVYRLVYLVLAVLEVILAFRFVLKLLGANPESIFAALIYVLSALFLWPFWGLFAPAVSHGGEAQVQSIFEPSTIMAMVVYYVIAWLIAKWILIDRAKPHTVQGSAESQ